MEESWRKFGACLSFLSPCNKLQQTRWLEQSLFISSGFYKSEVCTWYGWILHSRYHRLRARCWAGWVLIWKLWGKLPFHAHSGCWPNSIPCSCRTESVSPCWLPEAALSPERSPTVISHTATSASMQQQRIPLTFQIPFFRKSLTPF